MSFHFGVSFRLVARQDNALKAAPRILGQELKGGLTAVGKRLTTASQKRMRKDTLEEVKSLQTSITGSDAQYNLLVFSTLIHAFIDAYGLPAGTQPPWGLRTRIGKWAAKHYNTRAEGTDRAPYTRGAGPKRVFQKRGFTTQRHHIQIRKKIKGVPPLPMKRSARMRAKDRNIKRVSFLVARAIYVKGIKPTHWNSMALQSQRRAIIRELQNALLRAATRIKRERG